MSRSLDSLEVMETFLTIQGEGPTVGFPTTFIRLQGCPFRCEWCDTKDSWAFRTDSSKVMTVDQIVNRVCDWPLHVCITGGEPLVQQAVYELAMRLQEDHQVCIETSGLTAINPLFLQYWEGQIIMDWKLPGSNEGQSIKSQTTMGMNLRALRANDVVKFVVKNDEDLGVMQEVLLENPEAKPSFYASPVFGELEASYIANFILQHKLDCAVQIQFHKTIGFP